MTRAKIRRGRRHRLQLDHCGGWHHSIGRQQRTCRHLPRFHRQRHTGCRDIWRHHGNAGRHRCRHHQSGDRGQTGLCPQQRGQLDRGHAQTNRHFRLRRAQRSLSFTKRPGTSGLTYAIQESTDLGVTYPWAEVPPGPSYTNDATTISCTLTPGIPAKNFLRLKVTSN